MHSPFVNAPVRPMPLSSVATAPAIAGSEPVSTIAAPAADVVRFKTVEIDRVKVFYREAGSPTALTIVLLHGYPTSSHMFRDLIPRLSDRYHVIAPDLPGFGQSDAPGRHDFDYSFDNYAKFVSSLLHNLGVERYALYVMDYGAPVGFRIASADPSKVAALVVQNGNAYDEGIGAFWDPIRAYWRTGAQLERETLRSLASAEATRWQYQNGVDDKSLLNPDTWISDQAGLDRPGNQEIQLDLLYDYRKNLKHYPAWQAYFHQHQPPTLVLWGRRDEIFVEAGAHAYKRDNPNAQVVLFDTGHFVLETHAAIAAALMRDFLGRVDDSSAGAGTDQPDLEALGL